VVAIGRSFYTWLGNWDEARLVAALGAFGRAVISPSGVQGRGPGATAPKHFMHFENTRGLSLIHRWILMQSYNWLFIIKLFYFREKPEGVEDWRYICPKPYQRTRSFSRCCLPKILTMLWICPSSVQNTTGVRFRTLCSDRQLLISFSLLETLWNQGSGHINFFLLDKLTMKGIRPRLLRQLLFTSGNALFLLS